MTEKSGVGHNVRPPDQHSIDLAVEALGMTQCPAYRAEGVCRTGCYSEPVCQTDEPTEGWVPYAINLLTGGSMPDSRAVSQNVSPDSEREPRDVVVEAMAAAGQKLAVQWGHQPWSDSWAKLVAETFVDALTVIDGGWICEAVVTGPDALFCGDCMAPARPGCDYSGHGVTTLGELMEAYR